MEGGVDSFMTAHRISTVILTMPAYNEAACLDDLLSDCESALGGLGLTWRVIVVDDGSSDGTAEIVACFSARNGNFQLVSHEMNRGLGPALLTAMNAALTVSDSSSTLICNMDADLTHSPERVADMIGAANDGADLVIASRFCRGSRQVGVPFRRQIMSVCARFLFQLTIGLPGVRDYTCGFRAIRANVLRAGVEKYGADGLISRGGFACTDELLLKLATLRPKIREIPFTLRYDLKRGASKIDLGVTISETLRLILWARRELRGDSERSRRSGE